MNVLQILPELNAGGVERTAVEITQALTTAGHGAHVLSAGGRMAEDIETLGGVNHFANIGSKNILSVPWRIAGIRRLIAEHRIDIVHARSRVPAWPAMFAARAENVPFLTTYHGIYNASSAPKRFYNSVMARGDHIIANSGFTKDHIVKTHGTDPENITVIYRGVDMAAFDPAKVRPAQVQARRAKWGLSKKQLGILLPGRLTRWKGQLVAVEALAGLPENYRLILQGDAQGREAYVQEIKALAARYGVTDRLIIASHSADIDVSLMAADVVISASTDPEAFGRIAAEAQAMGRPVIATAHGGALETVIEGVSGALVPPGDARSLAQSILGATKMDNVSLAKKRRAHIAKNFSKTALQAQTLAVYEKLLDASFSRDKT